MRFSLFLSILLLTGKAAAAPDEEALGKSQGYPSCERRDLGQTRCLISAVSMFDTYFPARTVAKAAEPRELKRAVQEPRFRYVHAQRGADLEYYLKWNRTTGLLILKDDTILVERYQYERTPAHRMNSFSMAKTIVAMLIGIALSEEKIKSIDDRADAYVPDLKGHPYGETPIRHLLTMSSGVRFIEDNINESDIQAMSRAMRQTGGGAWALDAFRTRERAPGERFNYASAETQVLGLVLHGATGKTLSDYASEKIWQPMGAEADASWVLDAGGYELAYSSFSATVRDFARFGMLLANGGARDGRQIIPAEWVKEATTVRGPHLRPGIIDNYFGYGYQTRVFPGSEGRFMAAGFRGQAIYVDPRSKVVMVHTAAREARDPGYAEQTSLFNYVADQLARPQ